MVISPIVLFLYNRPSHAALTLNSLAKNKLASASKVFVYIDGPKSYEDEINQEKILNLLNAHRNSFSKLEIYRSSENMGLANSVTRGVTEIVEKYGKVIVLEDDLVTSPFFLEYMNCCLDKYEEHPTVYSINGYMHPIKYKKNEIFLSPLATSSWGWATWKDKWSIFSSSEERYSKHFSDKDFIADFNFGDIDFFSMLKNPKSWAIQWYYSVREVGGLGVFPTRSFVSNVGFDGSGENCGKKDGRELTAKELPPIKSLFSLDSNSIFFEKNIKKAYTPNKSLLKRIIGKAKWFKEN